MRLHWQLGGSGMYGLLALLQILRLRAQFQHHLTDSYPGSASNRLSERLSHPFLESVCASGRDQLVLSQNDMWIGFHGEQIILFADERKFLIGGNPGRLQSIRPYLDLSL